MTAQRALFSILAVLSSGCGVSCAVLAVGEPFPFGWHQRLQVYGGWFERETAEQVGVTATIWNPGAPLLSDAAALRDLVAQAHQRGWPYVATETASMLQSRFIEARPELSEARRVDIDGGYPLAAWVEPSHFMADSNHPAWKAFLMEAIRRDIDCGVDGILIDDAVGTYVWDGGVFNPATAAVFRDYLRARYSVSELVVRFGIADIDSFELGQYLRARGGVDLWKERPWEVVLYNDLRICLLEASRDFIDDLVADGRRYARERYGREVVFTANISDLSEALIPSGNSLDFFMIEYHYDAEGGMPPAGRASVAMTLARAFGLARPQWVIGTNTAALMSQMPKSDNLIQLYIAETFAAGGGLASPPSYAYSPETGPGVYAGNPAAMAPYYRFVLENRILYEEVQPDTAVAVLYSYPTRLLHGEFIDSYFGASLALLDGHCPFSAVIAGRPGLVDRDFSLDGLRRYRMLVLPGVSSLSDSQWQAILQYCAEGGSVLALGPLATEDGEGTPVSRPELEMLSTPGGHAYGKGTFVYHAENLAASYFRTRNPSDREEILRLLGIVATTTAPSSVNLFRWSAPELRIGVTHFLNYAYNLAADSVTSSPSFEAVVSIPAGLAAEQLQVYFLSEETDPVLLSFCALEDGLQITVPPIRVHGLVAVMPTELAAAQGMEVLADAHRRLTRLRHRRASTPELDVLDAALGQALAEGNHLRARNLAARIQEAIRPLDRPRILFDEAHQERDTMDWGRALRLAAQPNDNPYWRYFGGYRDATVEEFRFDSNLDQDLTDELLRPYDVLMFSVPMAQDLDGHPFTPEEIQAVHRFVRRGGGLLVLGDAGIYFGVNELTLPYGIEFESDTLFSDQPEGVSGVFPVTDFRHLDLVDAGAGYRMIWGCSLRLGEGAIPLAFSGADTWQELDGVFAHAPEEPLGPFPVAALSEDAGRGRVACLGDNNFQWDPAWGIPDRRNWELLTRLMRWLVRSGEEKSVLRVPYVSPVSGEFTGIAVTNASGRAGQLDFRSYDSAGLLMDLPSNPSTLEFGAGLQSARLASEIFGAGAALQASWVEVESDLSALGSFFALGDFASTQLTGAAADQGFQDSRIVFTRAFGPGAEVAGKSASSQFTVINPAPEQQEVTLALISSAGAMAAPPVRRTIPAKGLLDGNLVDFFGTLSESGYLTVESVPGLGLLGFELMRIGKARLVGLSAQPEALAARTLYSAQIAETQDLFCHVRVVNLSAATRQLRLTPLADDGTTLAESLMRTLDPGQLLEGDLRSLFAMPPGVNWIGSLAVMGDGAGLVGDVIVGDRRHGRYAVAMALQAETLHRGLFSHVANTPLSYTGLAIHNPGATTAAITLRVYRQDGSLAGESSFQMEAGCRLARLLTEWVPSSGGQAGGYVELLSSQGVVAQEVFGTMNLSTAAAVPPTVLH